LEQRLRETLNELRAELARSDAGDPDARDRVQAAAREIDAWLERSEEPESPLEDRLREAAVRLEEEHPNLAGAVRRVVDALSNLGI
jgi:hypothetical protein